MILVGELAWIANATFFLGNKFRSALELKLSKISIESGYKAACIFLN